MATTLGSTDPDPPKPSRGSARERLRTHIAGLLLAATALGCTAFGNRAPEFADDDLVEVELRTTDNRRWRITTAPDRSESEFAADATASEKRATPGEMQVLLESLADLGFFENATDTPTVDGGSLSVRIAASQASARSRDERWTALRPLADIDRAVRYRSYVDAFHNDGFNRITQLRPSQNPQSVLRDFQRGAR